MAQATLTAHVDAQDKIDFDTFCSNVGLNTSTAINLFVKAVLRENRMYMTLASVMQRPMIVVKAWMPPIFVQRATRMSAGCCGVGELEMFLFSRPLQSFFQ